MDKGKQWQTKLHWRTTTVYNAAFVHCSNPTCYKALIIIREWHPVIAACKLSLLWTFPNAVCRRETRCNEMWTCRAHPSCPIKSQPTSGSSLQWPWKRAGRRHDRPSFLLLLTPPPRRVSYLFVPTDPGWAVGRRGLVYSRQHAYVVNLFSLSLCPGADYGWLILFAPVRGSSSTRSEEYYCLRCNVLYPALHHCPHWVSLTVTPSCTITRFLDLNKIF